MSNYSKVLIMRLTSLGDVATVLPQVYSLCNAYPATTFIMLTQHVVAGLFMNAPANLQVYIAEAHARHKGAAGLWQLYSELRGLGIDAVADLQGSLRTKVLREFFHLRGVPTFVVEEEIEEVQRMTIRDNKRLAPVSAAGRRYADVFAAMGMPYELKFKTLYPEGRGDAGLFSHITSPKAAGEKWIGIAPFAKYKSKIYPIEKMEQVVAALSREKNLRIFLFGAGSDGLILQEWGERYENVVSLAERRLGFTVELALISYLDVMLSMDSANMHLAALVDIPVVSLWGATHPYAGFMGYTAREEDVIQVPMSCRPCSAIGDKSCYRGDYACLHKIAPETITSHLMSVVAREK